MGHSASRDQIVRRALRLSPDMEASGLRPWAGVAEVATALNLAPGPLLVDLGCGRGGYSLEIARQTGARLLGLDFSAVAVAIARGRTGVADAVVCIETIMFAGAHRGRRSSDRVPAGTSPPGLELFDSSQAKTLDEYSTPIRCGKVISKR